jgi:hypothetical protein
LSRLRWTLLSTPSKTLELLARTPDDPAEVEVSSNNAELMWLGETEFSKRVSQRINSDAPSATTGPALARGPETRAISLTSQSL